MFTFFSYGYLDVSVPHVRLRFADNRIASVGLPHSDICGSMSICLSPQLFAACHVLLRLREPRHPPCALSLLRCSVRKEHKVLPFCSTLYSFFASEASIPGNLIATLFFIPISCDINICCFDFSAFCDLRLMNP